MPLTSIQRKKRLPRGAQKEIAIETGESRSTVSAVVNNKAQNYARETVEKIQNAVAGKIGQPVQEVFGSKAA